MSPAEALFALLEGLVAISADVHARWPATLDRAGLDFRLGDLVHHVCMAAAEPHPLLAREAYLSVLAYATALFAGERAGISVRLLADPRAIVAALLDALDPSASPPRAVPSREVSPVLAWCAELARGGSSIAPDGR